MNNIFIIFVGAVYWAWALLSSNLNYFFCIYMREYYTLLVYYCVSDSRAKEEEIRKMEGGSSYDSLPHDIILHIFSYIFSRLPLDCVFRLKCVCKAWSVLISDFEALHLKRLRETSRGIICPS